MILSLRIAFKFHRSYKRNVFLSLVSLISIISIIIGISISIIALSVINGFEYELSRRILSVIPHGEISLINTPFTDWKTILNRIKKIPNIVHANPYINFPGIIEFNNKWHFIYIKSINLMETVNKYSNHRLINFIEEKSWKYFCEHKNQIILGKGVSIALKIKTGDWITILFTHNLDSDNKLLLSPKKIRVQVSGILNLHSQLDNHLAIISLSEAQSYCDNRLDVDGIEISVNDVFCINQIIQKIKNKLHKNIKIRSWMNMYGYIYRDIQMVRLIVYLSVILIIVLSCFNVITTLILSIKNKNYDIAILRALGARNILIQHIFLWYGFIIYCVSSFIGSSAGILISLNLTNISIRCMDIFGSNFFPRDIYFIDFIPVKVHGLDVCVVLTTVLILGLLISWYSSLKTKKVNLTKILK